MGAATSKCAFCSNASKNEEIVILEANDKTPQYVVRYIGKEEISQIVEVVGTTCEYDVEEKGSSSIITSESIVGTKYAAEPVEHLEIESELLKLNFQNDSNDYNYDGANTNVLEKNTKNCNSSEISAFDFAVVPPKYRCELDNISKLNSMTPSVLKIEKFPRNSMVSRIKIQFTSGAAYFGDADATNNVLEGMGILFWSDGTFYFGEWVNNQPHGYGFFSCSDGREYVGEWEDGSAHGRGYFLSNSGGTYYGQLKNDMKCGLGEEIFPDKSTYAGEYADGMKQGSGVFTWPNGVIFIGSWSFNRKRGNGKLKVGNLIKYRGEWEDCQMHGIGECRLQDGCVYRGEHYKGELKGFGECVWPDGAKQHGYWEGVLHGDFCQHLNGIDDFINSDMCDSRLSI